MINNITYPLIMLTHSTMNNMRWSEQTSSPHDGGAGAPTIKNHSVTHFAGNLYCFGGYDGRRNHMTLLLYSIRDKRWFRPHHVGVGACGTVAPQLARPCSRPLTRRPIGRRRIDRRASRVVQPVGEEEGVGKARGEHRRRTGGIYICA